MINVVSQGLEINIDANIWDHSIDVILAVLLHYKNAKFYLQVLAKNFVLHFFDLGIAIERKAFV